MYKKIYISINDLKILVIAIILSYLNYFENGLFRWLINIIIFLISIDIQDNFIKNRQVL